MRWLRRLLVLSAVVAVAVLLVRRRADANVETPVRPAGDDQWPPIDVHDEPTWVLPEDGTCPLTHPIKVNGSSGIFHLPGGRFYERSIPSRCYAEADDAVADGYRAAKA